MKISASIVLYKNEPEKVYSVLNCLGGSGLEMKTYILDNSPRSAGLDLSPFHNLHYVKLTKNVGFGPAHNLAIKKSLDSGCRYHLVINPDIFFPRGVLEKLHKYMEANPDVGNIMPKVCYPDGRNQYLAKLLPTPGNLAVRLFHRFLPQTLIRRVNGRYELHDLPLDQPIEVPSLSGCFMFLRCNALRKVGLFDERFFLYFEDYDLVRRISRHFKTVYYPGIQINHDFERASRKNLSALFVHLASAVKYFNKWGWYRDDYRELSNAKVISGLDLMD